MIQLSAYDTVLFFLPTYHWIKYVDNTMACKVKLTFYLTFPKFSLHTFWWFEPLPEFAPFWRILCEPDSDARDVFIAAMETFKEVVEAFPRGVVDPLLAAADPLAFECAVLRTASAPRPSCIWDSTGWGAARTAGPRGACAAEDADDGAAAAAAKGFTAATAAGVTVEDWRRLLVAGGPAVWKVVSCCPFGLVSDSTLSLSPAPLHRLVPCVVVCKCMSSTRSCQWPLPLNKAWPWLLRHEKSTEADAAGGPCPSGHGDELPFLAFNCSRTPASAIIRSVICSYLRLPLLRNFSSSIRAFELPLSAFCLWEKKKKLLKLNDRDNKLSIREKSKLSDITSFLKVCWHEVSPVY